jgi:predicted protein tyrosine phosphatase
VVSLLTDDEEQELDLVDEGAEARKHDLVYVSCPIPDRGVPSDPSTLSKLLETLHRDLQQGKHVLVHCRQGIGRAGLVAASLLVHEGMEPESAIQEVSKMQVFIFRRRPNRKAVFTGLRHLKPLHSSLIQSELDAFHKMGTDDLRRTLAPGQPNCLKARPDATILDGHHRVHVLRTRAEDVDSLPREVVPKTFSE